MTILLFLNRNIKHSSSKTGQAWCFTAFTYCLIPLNTHTICWFFSLLAYQRMLPRPQSLIILWIAIIYETIKYLHGNVSLASLIFFYLYHLKRTAEKKNLKGFRNVPYLSNLLAGSLQLTNNSDNYNPLKQLNRKNIKNVNKSTDGDQAKFCQFTTSS